MEKIVKVKLKGGKAFYGTISIRQVTLPETLFALLKSKGEGGEIFVAKSKITPVKKNKNGDEDNQ